MIRLEMILTQTEAISVAKYRPGSAITVGEQMLLGKYSFNAFRMTFAC